MGEPRRATARDSFVELANSIKVESAVNLTSRFLLADVVFTFLPLGVIALMRLSLGQLEPAFLMNPEWSFAAIMVYGLAMTRVLELKVRYQRDRSERVFVLARVCILGIVAAVVSLALAQMKLAGLPVAAGPLLALESAVIGSGLALLFLAHWARDDYLRQKTQLHEGTSLTRYLVFLEDDLRAARDRLDALVARCTRRDACSFSAAQEVEYGELVRRRTRDVDLLLADIEDCVRRAILARQSWSELGDHETAETPEDQLPRASA